MRFTLKLLAALAVGVTSIGTANADPITIDSFMDPPGLTFAPLPASSLNVGGPTGDLPGIRDINFSPTLPLAGGNSAAVGGGQFEFFTGDDGVSSILEYKFDDAPLDFSGLDKLFLDFNFIDGGTNVTSLPFKVEFLTGSGASTAMGAISDVAGAYTLELAKGLFNNPLFLNDVSGLRITFNASLQQGADFRLLNIRADGDGGVFEQGDPVPEPASMILFGALAVGGIAAVRRKLRRPATV